MTKEEKEKAIDALKISAPVMAMTQEEFIYGFIYIMWFLVAFSVIFTIITTIIMIKEKIHHGRTEKNSKRGTGVS